MLSTDEIVAQIDRALAIVEEARRRSRYDDCSDLGDAEVSRLNITLRYTIERLTLPGSTHRKNTDDITGRYGSYHSSNIQYLAGILRALRQDYLDGYLKSVQELLHASVFADFLEMADHLLGEGYKDAAAVLAGGVLEGHLRALATKKGLDVTDPAGRSIKADRMNADLASAGVHSKMDQKTITAWLDLRNKAAHAQYSEYSGDQVGLLIQGVRDFIMRHPA